MPAVNRHEGSKTITNARIRGTAVSDVLPELIEPHRLRAAVDVVHKDNGGKLRLNRIKGSRSTNSSN